MAVTATGESLHRTAIDLILPRPLKFYGAPMSSGHWQLRSLICSPRPNTLFYPNGKDIVVLNTETHESYLLTTLSFEPRCLTTSNGWLCCGGENGDYAAIYFGCEAYSDLCSQPGAEPVSSLQQEQIPSWRSRSIQKRNIHIWPLLEITSTVGAEIVNCISIWSPSDISSERTYSESVALVSNNDQSISILSLANSRVIEKLTLPDCVNRSLMSPDGDMLISVCDDPFLYIHRRKFRDFNKNDPPHSKERGYYWDLEGRVQLEGQLRADRSESRGSFAASFSPSGKYLAVATQYGIISVFDKEEIFAPPVSIFTSSRMNDSGEGYVRVVEFCSGSFDLLAWTESKGRIGVADVRDLFVSRQILFLDPTNLEDVEKISINDRPEEPSWGTRHLRADSIQRVIQDTSGLVSGNTNLRQSRMMTRGELNALSHRRTQLRHLDPHVSRQQREGSLARVEAPTTSAWRNSIEIRRPISITYSPRDIRSVRNYTAGLPETLREFLSQDRAPSFRSFINDRNRENERRNHQEHEGNSGLPRNSNTQNNIIPLADSENLVEREIPRNERYATANMERLSLSLSQDRDNESESSWTRTNSPQQLNTGQSLSNNEPSNTRTDEEDVDRAETENRMDELIDFALDAQRIFSAQRNRSQGGIFAILGLCWSQDGKILYAATEDGVHEYHVNIRGRKLFPRLALC
ncbi:putative wd domain containing protein [Golovinomyces cichoracearum]|uniref:Putative wd domain containing protein n=1 Tax=Golovinomyces cichoracearum TaxID=62708 RepID=A0A420HDB4_9PEZI|nr:putative wd domain containing protein [Golovinomyces cichoracearum]